jgi:hypothetical protein
MSSDFKGTNNSSRRVNVTRFSQTFPTSGVTRKRFLKLAAACGVSLLAMPRLLRAADSELRGPLLTWARLKFTCRGGDDDDWNVHPNGDLNLIDAIRRQTSANVEKHWYVADVSRLETMTPFPFIFMHAELAPALTDGERANLREHLLRGGFLFAEDCVNGKGRSDRSKDEFFRRMVQVEFPKILPEARLEKLPDDHPVFHCFHDLKDGMPNMNGLPHGLHGLMLNGRVVAFLSGSDIHCGWANGDQWFGHAQQVRAMQMGINIYLFALTQPGATGDGLIRVPPATPAGPERP